MSAWIRCGRRKPPRYPEQDHAVILFFGGEGDGTCDLGYYDHEDREWMVQDGPGCYELAVPTPTHWMPLPHPPHRGSGSDG